MALEHSILVSLAERSSSGYDLARRFDKSIGFFWSATHQQIYRTLKRMLDAGWVNAEEVVQDGKPDKKVYRISDAGRGELSRWIAEPSDPSLPRDELAVKLRGASYGDVAALLAEMKRHRDARAERLDLYRRFEKQDFSAPAELSGSALHQYLVLRAGIRVEEGFTQWCDEVIAALGSAAPTATENNEREPE
ncbi:PadR family transcriptional regulator [Smaragdicoccus niigatensis]|uniref:PadR family transcriptional regulator n=1 Tax=Smaragdicoccus niigatensis TaxID=359359 RepID=UPI0003739A78|nr:PadR family transcriptional regulator [Smaragdicoccus niigatensis]